MHAKVNYCLYTNARACRLPLIRTVESQGRTVVHLGGRLFHTSWTYMTLTMSLYSCIREVLSGIPSFETRESYTIMRDTMIVLVCRAGDSGKSREKTFIVLLGAGVHA